MPNADTQRRMPAPEMSDEDFDALAQLVYRHGGIALDRSQKPMLIARLLKRVQATGCVSLHAYRRHVCDPRSVASELGPLLDVVTTHTTSFFRERNHFTVLQREILPALIAARQGGEPPHLTCWSAGCSTGEEPYSLAMVLDAFRLETGCDYTIHATDLSREALQTAQAGIYPQALTAAIPEPHRQRHLMHGRNGQEGRGRIVPELREKIVFAQHNLMDAEFDLPRMDLVFCRNVIIYFDDRTKRELIDKLHRQLRPGGYLFLGHSETLHGLSTRFAAVAPTVYQAG